MEDDTTRDATSSPTNSQKTVSDDEEIDYSVKPELYDAELDEKDEVWAQKERKGRASHAVLSCPACFTTLSIDCQRHEKYVTQYRAMFVVNCKIGSEGLVQERSPEPKGRKRQRGSNRNAASAAARETLKQVCCQECSTEVGVMDEDEIYHFFNVLPSES